MNHPNRHTLLIVDDNPNNLFALNELIRENFEVEVLQAKSGFEALKAVSDREISLCLMDVQMPEMDGFETARLIHARPSTSHIPICFITAFDPGKTLLARGVEAGGLDYLTKPIDDIQIVQTLRMYLRFLDRERNINHELEEKVGERTRELKFANDQLKKEIEIKIQTEAGLKKTKEELQMANAAKDKFFSIIAHDLRSPFNAILGLSEILTQQFEDLEKPEIGEFVHLLHQSAQNAFLLLDNLLTWSRCQTGKLIVQPTAFHLAELIPPTLLPLLEQAKAKEIQITQSISPESAVFADQILTPIILKNLLSNAIKFSPRGKTVSLLSIPTDEGWTLRVSDEGVGIKPEVLQKIFSIENKTQTKGTEGETGTGLGLILCQELAEKMGGRIKITSQEGKGCTVDLELPPPPPG